MYVDASALVAIALRENDRDELLGMLERPGRKMTSVVSVFEAIMAIGRETGDHAIGPPVVRELLSQAGIEISEIGSDLIDDLADAHLRHGKGSGSPARLNLGDCFSYAMAKRAGVPLLYTGNDFALTDLA